MTSAIPGFFQGTEMPNSGWWETLWPDPAAVLSATGIKPGMEVIDLCCGDGWFTLPMASMARHVLAIDIDADLLEVARHRLTESGVTNCDFVAGDAYELSRLAPRPADFIFMANAFHGVPDRPRLARGAVDAQPWWSSRHPQLAPASTRNNDRPGRASWTEDRIEAVT